MLQVGGAGEIDLNRSHIDYLSRVTLVVVPLGPDSGPLASLRGVTLPVRVKGPLSGPDWHLEPGASLPSAVLGAGQAAARNLPKVIPKPVVRAVSKVVKKAAPAAEKAAEEAATE
jgi:AsmA protein